MGQQIIKQPNGKYAVWSSVVDATVGDIINDRIEESNNKIREDVNRIVKALGRGEKPYHQFTMTFDEAVGSVMDNKPESNSLEILRELKLIK
jgi:hypothetical protein